MPALPTQTQGVKMKINGIEFKEDLSVEVRALRIGPDQAKVALEHMVKNQRKLSPARVREYVKQMQDEKWGVSNDAAVVCDGEWLNANHRLNAIVDSGTEQTMLVLFVADSSIMRIMDGGKPRSLGDVLKMETATTYAKDISSIGLLYLAYKKKLLTCGGSNLMQGSQTEGLSLKRLITRQDKIAFLIKNQKDLLTIAEAVKVWNTEFGVLPVSVGGAAFLAIEEKDGSAVASKFLEAVYSGDNMDGATRLLRQFLVKDANCRKRCPQVVKLAMCLKAYTSSRNGTVPGQLSIKSTDSFPEI